ncbi:MAG: hydantoinase/oxoprolinase family protein [Pseudomonadota bacterium]
MQDDSGGAESAAMPTTVPDRRATRPGWRIGADIGGTFTDIAMLDAAGRRLAIEKLPTTPAAPDDAVIAGIRALIAREGVAPDDVALVVHGTTLFTNALIERRGAVTALVTTEGFRDAVEIGREHRYDMYDLAMERPEPLAPRRRRFEIAERVLADGTIRRPLDDAAGRRLARHLVEEGVEAVAVSFLHAYAWPAHEQAMGRILAEEAPGLAVTLSHEVAPEIREYERTSTALANVYVQRIAERYLGRMERRLAEEAGIAAPLYIMQSNGALADVAQAMRFPVRLVESGPAAGALAAAHWAGRRGGAAGQRDLMSFDMGGTTAKAAVIADARPLTAPDFEVDRRYRFKKGSGLPVKTPVIELIEIGTGGGSIAARDTLGRLRVGPASAGAVPGPACYGLGGAAATVTDADLVLGFLDPAFFAGGAMTLDVAAARRALTDGGGDDPEAAERAAIAVARMADEAMAAAARLHAVERGIDASRLALFAFGGAGPVHAWGVARILRSPAVIYPPAAGVMSAIGFLAAPVAVDRVATLPAPVTSLDWAAARTAVAAMVFQARLRLSPSVAQEAMRARLSADMHYVGQGYEIPVTVPLPDGLDPADPSPALAPSLAGPLMTAFEDAYRALYGHTVPDGKAAVAVWRLSLEGPPPAVAPDPTGSGDRALKGHRRAFLPGAGGASGAFADVPVYDRYALAPGTVFEGPAIVEERESTAVIAGPARITLEPDGSLIARPPAG